MSTGRDFLWQEMLRLWQRLDKAQREELLEEARRLCGCELLKPRLPDQDATQP